MNKTCIYYCEGEDDQKLIDAMKIAPGKILPGKTKKLNVVQSLIPKSILLGIKQDTNVAPDEFNFAERNSELIKRYKCLS